MLVLLITFFGKWNSWAALCVVAASLSVWFWFLYTIPASFLSFILTATSEHPIVWPCLSSTPWFCFWRQGDVSETIRIFFEQSKTCPPAAKSLLTIQEVDEFLIQLSKLTKEDDQQSVLQQISRRWGEESASEDLPKHWEWFSTSWSRWKINYEPQRLSLISICKLLLVVWLRHLDSSGEYLWLMFVPENFIPACQDSSISTKQVICRNKSV